jgi:predicted transcriptional regulator
MPNYVTISIPEPLYRRARELARAWQRPLDAVIAEALEQSLPLESTGSEEAAVQREMQAYLALHTGLKATYLGQYVAVLDGQLIDHDQDMATLYGRINERFPDRFVWLTLVEDEALPTLNFRSPRFVSAT